MIYAGIVVAAVWGFELLAYIFMAPDSSPPSFKTHLLDRYIGRAAYGAAYLLSLLRAPLGLLPYLVKLFIFFGLNIHYESSRSTYFRELINMFGDIVNVGLTALLLLFLIGPPNLRSPTVLLYVPIASELVRIFAERVPAIFSAAWQLLPHRRIACAIQARAHSHRSWRLVARCLARYCRYYVLSDRARAEYVLHALKWRARCDLEVFERLKYIQTFRIIPQYYGLRGGRVRDVANAEVFIHASWTNDPWLLAGMALRRSPWIFDPRYVHRPFYYMTVANRLATLFVLQHARYSIPYAIFQFGHEIRVARLHLFYRTLRWLGADVEKKVWADGTFQFDQFIFWLKMKYAHGVSLTEQHSLYSDEEVIGEVTQTYPDVSSLSALDIATRYTYPLEYMEEILLPRVKRALASQLHPADTGQNISDPDDPQTAQY